jgi:hypothetical protein
VRAHSPITRCMSSREPSLCAQPFATSRLFLRAQRQLGCGRSNRSIVVSRGVGSRHI